MHPRRQILEDIRDNLVAEKAFSWVRITRLPVIAARGITYPAASLYFENEPVTTETIHLQPRPQTRTPILVIRVWIMGTQDVEYLDAQMDIQAERVERLMSNRIKGVDDIRLIATDFDAPEEEPGLAVVSLSYQVDYDTLEFLE